MSDTVIDGEFVEEDALPSVREPAPSTALVARDQISVDELLKQAGIIEAAMQQAMTPEVHYGHIPGIKKPTLLKPGAEKLNVLFRLAPSYQSDKTWHEDGHLTVVTKCILTHIPSSLVVGEGEGLCTTKETKYAYRTQKRTCPACGAEAIIKGKAEYGGGWLCWKKENGCGAKFDDGDAAVENQETGKIGNPDLADSYNCVTPDTRILTRELRWIPAGELATGDVLIGVNEDLPNQNGRRYEESTATIGDRFVDDIYEIRTADGRVVRCNGEHRWLVKSLGSGVEWVSTETIFNDYEGRPRTGRPRRWQIMSVGMPWETEDSYDAGYMAGLLDADGCLGISRARYHSVVVQFAQQAGGVLSKFVSALGERAFSHRMYPHGNKVMREPVYTVAVGGGLLEQMRLLGTVRPPRLIERWDTVDLTQRRFEGRIAVVESVRYVGRGELVRLGTSSHTYIAEGMVCHNTVLKMAAKRALIAGVLNCTAASDIFTQDMEDGARETPAGGSAPRAESKPAAEFNPATDLLPNAISGDGFAKRLSDALNAIDPSVDWEDVMAQAVQGVWSARGSRKDLTDAERPEFWTRLANAAEKIIVDSGQSEWPQVPDEKIKTGFAWAFNGVQVELTSKTSDAALTPAQVAEMDRLEEEQRNALKEDS